MAYHHQFQLGYKSLDGLVGMRRNQRHIFYSNDDIHHVGFWSGNLARRSRCEAISGVADDFSDALTFTYAHLAGLCRRKEVLRLFQEDQCNATTTYKCCDVCESEIVDIRDKKTELALLVSAIDELGNRGEVRVTEWIRGGQLAWMKGIEIKPNSVYGKGSNFTKQWWRKYIRQVTAAGYIRRTIQTASFGTSNGVYASLTVTEKARDAIAGEKSVLLPEFQMEKEISSVHSFTTNVRQDVLRKRRERDATCSQ